MSHSQSLQSLGFLRTGVAAPELRSADVHFNSGKIGAALDHLAAAGCRVALFPELCITGYSCADLFFQSLLVEHAQAALPLLAERAHQAGIAAVVGLPLALEGRLFNCAALLAGGRVVGIVPKTYLPNTNEFYEERWFTSARLGSATSARIGGRDVPFGTDLLFRLGSIPGCTAGIEICEDLWAVEPPSGRLALAGATLILNPSASNELLGKAEYRRDLVRQQSARCHAAYLYAGAGPGESTTDTVYSGHCLIAENGLLLAETERFSFSTQTAMADLDVQHLIGERRKNSSFSAGTGLPHRVIEIDVPDPESSVGQATLLRPLSRTPFVPSDPERRAEHCREIFAIQSTGLARRLVHTGSTHVTLGVSGGLDSTLALLVTAKAFDALGLDRQGIVAIAMPGFGTTSRTSGNAEKLVRALGTGLRRIPIVDAVRLHFRDIGHDETVYDVVYENAQARERTQVLMDVANQVGGFVVGTGDLSELALGWCTYNGDQMSMYHVNAGVPKTLVRTLVEWCAVSEFPGEAGAVLLDICATPITPELLPPGEGEALRQKTEDSIGPYLLHDFFLYYTLRHLFAPRRVLSLACQAFDGAYSPEEVLGWMRVFYRRFFAHQFKRSAMPDGPKVGSVALSPRADWRMPSDASPALWLRELDELAQEMSPLT